MGSVDILINNAGITKDNLFMRMSDDEWSSVLEVNLTSTMRLCKGVIRGMMKARWGRIVNISSIVGATGNPGQANYAASKPKDNFIRFHAGNLYLGTSEVNLDLQTKTGIISDGKIKKEKSFKSFKNTSAAKTMVRTIKGNIFLSNE